MHESRDPKYLAISHTEHDKHKGKTAGRRGAFPPPAPAQKCTSDKGSVLLNRVRMNIPSPSTAWRTEGGRREYSYQLAWVLLEFSRTPPFVTLYPRPQLWLQLHYGFN